MSEARAAAATRLAVHLAGVAQLRRRANADPAFKTALLELKSWQSKRLAGTYPDLLASPRYRNAALFFLNDLYGPKDFSKRGEDVARILPKLRALLPAAALSAIADAVALDELSETLDQALLHALDPATAITEQNYATAYRACAEHSARERQINLTQEICTAVDRLTHVPLMLTTLKMMRAPARIAGLAELQHFLENGFVTFKSMNGAEEFLGIILARETRLMERLFTGTPEPFAGLAETG